MKILSRKELREKKGIKWTPQYIGRLERRGKFPRRRYLGPRTPGWVEDEVDAWLRDRITEYGDEAAMSDNVMTRAALREHFRPRPASAA